MRNEIKNIYICISYSLNNLFSDTLKRYIVLGFSMWSILWYFYTVIVQYNDFIVNHVFNIQVMKK